MTDRTDRWLLLVVALIGVALLVPAVSAGGTNGTTDGLTDWMHTNVWGGDTLDNVGPHAQTRGGHGHHHGGGFQGPAADGYHGPGAEYDTNDSRYGGYGPHAGPHHGAHHGWMFGTDSGQDGQPVNVSHPGVYANDSAYHHGPYANETYHPGEPIQNETYHPGEPIRNGTYYLGSAHENDTYRPGGAWTDDTSDSDRRYRGGPGGCH